MFRPYTLSKDHSLLSKMSFLNESQTKKNKLASKLIPMNMEFFDENSLSYLDNDQIKKYQAHFEDGKLYTHNKLIVEKKLLFVVDENNTLFVKSYHQDKKFHHSYFVSGKPVKAAGMIETNINGEIAMISNESGHYTPTTVQMLPVLKYFIDHMQLSDIIDQVEYEAHDNAITDRKVYVFYLSEVLNFKKNINIREYSEHFICSYNTLNSASTINRSNTNSAYDYSMGEDEPSTSYRSRFGMHLKSKP